MIDDALKNIEIIMPPKAVADVPAAPADPVPPASPDHEIAPFSDEPIQAVFPPIPPGWVWAYNASAFDEVVNAAVIEGHLLPGPPKTQPNGYSLKALEIEGVVGLYARRRKPVEAARSPIEPAPAAPASIPLPAPVMEAPATEAPAAPPVVGPRQAKPRKAAAKPPVEPKKPRRDLPAGPAQDSFF